MGLFVGGFCYSCTMTRNVNIVVLYKYNMHVHNASEYNITNLTVGMMKWITNNKKAKGKYKIKK